VWDSASRPVGGLGRAGLNTVSERKPCKTGLSEGQRALIEPVIAAWKAAHPSVSGYRGVGRLIGLDLAAGWLSSACTRSMWAPLRGKAMSSVS
jgi:hypothetical protein